MTLHQKRFFAVSSMIFIFVGFLICFWLGISFAEVLIKNLGDANYSKWNLVVILMKVFTGV